jgi:hypothetical protein
MAYLAIPSRVILANLPRFMNLIASINRRVSRRWEGRTTLEYH